MTVNHVIQEVERAFSKRKRPKQVTRHTGDPECAQIQREFGQRSRDALDPKDAAMLIVDGALLSDAAVLYFLPAVAKAVLLLSTGDTLMLRRRLEALESGSLNSDEQAALRNLLRELDEADARMEGHEGARPN